MKVLKWILIIIVLVIAIPVITALFVEKDYAVVRTIVINRPSNEVFDYVKYLRNQDNYSKWAMMDPAMEKTYTGTDATIGFISGWDSDSANVGRGEQEIVGITDGERVDFELRFFEPWESTEQAYLTTEAIDSSHTKVSWGFNGHMDYPMNLMLLTMDFDEAIGGDLQTGLTNLKTVLEK